MASEPGQYLDKLDFVAAYAPGFDTAAYDRPVSEWTRAEKARLTREYNKLQLAIAPTNVGIPVRDRRTGEVKDYRRDDDHYAYMLRKIRPFVTGFGAKEGYNLRNVGEWTRGQKAQVTKYYKALSQLAARPFHVYTSRDKDKVAQARRITDQDPSLKKIKGALVPVSTFGEKPHISVTDRGTMEATTDRMQKLWFDWDFYGITPEEIAIDPEGATQAVIDQQPPGVLYGIQTGQYEFGKGVPLLFPEQRIASEVAKLVSKYSADNGYDPDDSNSSWFGNWLFGLTGYRFPSVKDRTAWVRSTRAYAERRREERRKKRRQIRRERERKKRAEKRGRKR